MAVRYVPGNLTLIVGRHSAVMVTEAAEGLITDLWEAVSNGKDVVEIIDVLSAQGIAAMPGFACLLWSDAAKTRIFLRGEFTARVRTEHGEEFWDGTGVSTWVERSLHDAETSTVEIHAGDVDSKKSFPVSEAVVLASRLVLAPGDLMLAPIEVSPVAGEPESAVRSLPATESAPELKPQPDSVPRPSPEPVARQRNSTETRIDPEADSFDALFGATIARGIEDAAVRVTDEQPTMITGVPEVAAQAADQAGDHDGHTIAAADRKKLTQQRKAVPVNRTAGVLATLTLPSGEQIPVDRPVFVGRSPAARQKAGADLPRLVKVASSSGDISRTHLEIRLDGSDLVATDVSTNGTVLVHPGSVPQRLQPNHATLLTDGSTLDLGDEITIAVQIQKASS